MKKITILIICMLFFSSLGFAAEDARKGKGKDIFEQLDLSKEQIVQIKAQRKEHLATIKGLNKELNKVQKKLEKELSRSEPGAEALEDLSTEIKSIQGKLLDQRLDSLVETKKILTEGQYKKLMKIIRERHKEKEKEED